MIYSNLLKKETSLSVIGLGYVGLPIALEFARKIKVIGFDIKPERVELMKKGIDPSNELSTDDFMDTDIEYTTNPEDLRKASFHIIAVPTPTDRHNLPDLTPVLKASETVGRILKKGDMSRRYIRAVPKKTAYRCLRDSRGSDIAPISRQASPLRG